MLRDGPDPKEIAMTTFAKTCSAAVLMLALATPASSASAQRASADGLAPGDNAGARSVLKQSCGNLPKTEVVRNNGSQNTDSTTFVLVNGSEADFKVGGTAASCVIVSFSAQAFAQGPFAVMRVRALLDGNESSDGSIQLVAESENFSDAHAYNFLFPSVAPGVHSFRMEYLSVNNDTVFINDFDLNIRHR
jgi:hypothetical protein